MSVQSPAPQKKPWFLALLSALDGIFVYLTAGISTREFRAMLRGDAPGRPNTRLTPHADAFLLHIKPSYYHESVTRFTHTYRLGLLSTYLFLFETITGIILMIWYAPTPERAYVDMIRLMNNVPFGQLMRDLHRIGAELMVGIVTLHMVRTYLTGSYKPPREFTWLTGVLLLVITLFLSFSGYLLPWDQLAFWAVTIGTSMAEAVPPTFVGEIINLLARGAPDIGANGLLRFYLLHVLFLPLLLILFFFVHYYKVVLYGISLPAQEEEVGEDTANRVPANRRVYYLPEVLLDEGTFLLAVTAIITAVTVFLFQAPLEHIANPQQTPFHTVAPWYFYWLQGLLKIADKMWAGVIIPGVLLVMLMAIPYLDRNPSRRGADRRIATISGIVAGILMIILSWMGTPAYAVQGAPALEVVEKLMPEEKVGTSREIGYSHIPLGTYDTREPIATDDAEFAKLLDEFVHLLEAWEDKAPDFNDPWGLLTVTQDQANLKRLRWEVMWLSDAGTEEYFKQDYWLHKDSYYWEQYGRKKFGVPEFLEMQNGG